MSDRMTTYLDLVKECDNFSYDAIDDQGLYQLYLPDDVNPYGYITPDTIQRMPRTDDFRIDHTAKTVQVLDRSQGIDTGRSCTDSFSDLVTRCIDQDLFATIHGDHSEPFAIIGAWYPASIERFAAPLFGITNRGAHLIVYTRTADGLKIWVPRRSPNSHTYPNKLDTTVAGGIPFSETPFDTILHEAEEEASLPRDLVQRHARSVGVLTYIGVSSKGGACVEDVGLIMPDAVFVYDLEVSQDVVCKPCDDEVKVFYLMTVQEVKKAILGREFKTNSAVVMIDFFIRHGILTVENEPDYLEIVMRMHRNLPFRTDGRS